MSWLRCEKCGKKLLQRMPNGLFSFKFGRTNDVDNTPIVDLKVHGSLTMLCLKRDCRHRNVFNYFPPTISIENNKEPQSPKQKQPK